MLGKSSIITISRLRVNNINKVHKRKNLALLQGFNFVGGPDETRLRPQEAWG